MDFNQVRYFLALAETLNFTRAAEKCFVSQPALTQAIKRLEHELGGELVIRNGRYTELTELGSSLRSHFEQLSRTQQLVRNTAKSLVAERVTELNIGIMCTIGPRVLAPMLDKFQMAHPTTKLILHDVTPPSILSMLLSGGLEAVFCAHNESTDSRLSYRELFEEEVVVAFNSGHPLSVLDEVSLDNVIMYPYVERLHCEFRSQTHEYLVSRGVEFNVVFQSEREDWIQSLVHDGVGITIIPRYSLLRPELDHRSLSPTLIRKVGLATIAGSELSYSLKNLVEEASRYEWPVSIENQGGSD